MITIYLSDDSYSEHEDITNDTSATERNANYIKPLQKILLPRKEPSESHKGTVTQTINFIAFIDNLNITN